MMQTLKQIFEYLGMSNSLISQLFNSSYRKTKQAVLEENQEKLMECYHKKYSLAESNENILHVAIKNKKCKIAEFILDNIPEIKLEDKNDDGDTPFMLAVFQNDLNLLEVLLLHGANINTRENERSTPLIVAAANGFLDMVKWLIKNSANIDAENYQGQNALHRACFYGQLEIVRYLINNTHLKPLRCDRKGNNCLHLAAQGLSLNCIRYLLKKVKDRQKLELPNQKKQTPYDILLDQLNFINDNKELKITKQQIIDYLHDKTKTINIELKRILSSTRKKQQSMKSIKGQQQYEIQEEKTQIKLLKQISQKNSQKQNRSYSKISSSHSTVK